MMTGNEIREKFLEYFERQGHTRVRSSPLLPANDPTLLFTNAGMNQFKDVFLGVEKRDYVRACSSQKCLRAGGKHNDLDEVGKTARHQTFFEMLGNFSFGDYFKEDGIKFAWDLLVNEFKLDPQRMWFSVFEGDDEVGPDEDAEKFWQAVGAPKERILRFDRKDNFWQMGETGPCGPCSEIHYYMGDDPNDAENCAANVNGPTDIITELWNLVFMQFDRSEESPGQYKLTPLPAPSVDTGMGLERLGVVLQGVNSNYETDLLKNIVDFVAKLSDRSYESETQEGFAMRVIADHARATAFSIADGILPSNEGRNYVLRKIMRRAIYQGRHALGFEGLFFHKVTNFVVDQMGEAYPELESHREFIDKMVRLEEERFGSTLTVGLSKFEELLAATPEGKFPDWKDLARLYDTYGVPRDLIRVGLEERGLFQFTEEWSVSGLFDEETFNFHFDPALRDLQQASAVGKTEQKTGTKPIYADLANRVQSLFRGYETTRIDDAKVLAIIRGDEEVSELKEGEDGGVMLDQTPFYAEAGGQVGDVGTIIKAPAHENDTALIARVADTYSPVQGLMIHKVRVEKGTIKVGDTVTAEVDVVTRDATRRNHTATHLVHAALREVLGSHVKQAGSVVAPSYLRFDFTHYQPMTEDEVKEVERLVNEQILRNVKVDTDIMPVEDAIRGGAMALFGEKYSGNMRVLTVPGFSKELCGGTHVRATGDIGVFKITSDESIASGVRRIRAITGIDAYERFREDETMIEQAAANLRTSRAELPNVIGRLQEELKKARREAEELRLKIASGAVRTSASNGDEARDIAGVKVLAREASGLDAAGMRQLSDTLLARIKSGVVVLGRTNDGKASLIVRTSDDLTERVPAGQVIKELAPIIGGKGGGKADMAEAGGRLAQKLQEALDASFGIIERLLSGPQSAPNEKPTQLESKYFIYDRENLNLQFYETYDYNFLFKKAMTLLSALETVEKTGDIPKPALGLQEGMDEKFVETIRAEVHFTEFHQFEALFALMIAIFQSEPHWLYLTNYKTEDIKRKVQAFLNRDIAEVSNKHVSNLDDFINWSIYTGYAASPPTEERDWQVNIDNLVWLLDRIASKFLEGKEYNAYKHGLRTMQGPARVAIIPDENPTDAITMGADDTVSYLEFKEQMGHKMVYRTVKAFSVVESTNHLLAMRRMLETIRFTRLSKLRNAPGSHVLTFFELDKKSFYNLNTHMKWSLPM